MGRRGLAGMVALLVGCGSVSAISDGGGPEPGNAGAGGITSTSQGGAPGGSGSGGAGGVMSRGSGGGSPDAGASSDGGTEGLLGSYFASPRGTAFMTRVDPIIDFDPGPTDLQPEEVIWTGYMFIDGTQAVEIEANDDDQVSLTLGAQSTPAGSRGLTGIRTDLANLSGWQAVTLDVVRTDLSMPFRAVLVRQQLPGDGSPAPVTPAPSEVLRPE